jgi:K+-transporting ATPase ATPase C chain
MLSALRPAIVMLVLMTVLTGIAYPLAVTGLGRVLFPSQAHGSLVARDGRVVGSSLIAQRFTEARYFWPRPSAAGTDGYDAAASGGSNLGPTSKKLLDTVQARVSAQQAANGAGPVPVELVTASASGLDPDLSPAAADYQAARVAKARGLSEDAVRVLIAQHTRGRTFGVLGEPRVRVLELNLALDAASATH